MKILFFGDVYGDAGKRAILKNVKTLKQEHEIDFTIINAENVSSGKSLDKSDYDDFKAFGIDCFTFGNHTYFGNKIEKYIDEARDLVVPANYSPLCKDRGTQTFDVKGKTIRVTNILGKTFMQPQPECPFAALENIVEDDKSDIHIVDFHSEATSEKICFASHFDGRVNAVVGTHTHVQTADERILPKGTAFITDIGMNGPHHSAIGAQLEPVIEKMRSNLQVKFTQAHGIYQCMAIVIEFDDKTNKAISIQRINFLEK